MCFEALADRPRRGHYKMTFGDFNARYDFQFSCFYKETFTGLVVRMCAVITDYCIVKSKCHFVCVPWLGYVYGPEYICVRQRTVIIMF